MQPPRVGHAALCAGVTDSAYECFYAHHTKNHLSGDINGDFVSLGTVEIRMNAAADDAMQIHWATWVL